MRQMQTVKECVAQNRIVTMSKVAQLRNPNNETKYDRDEVQEIFKSPKSRSRVSQMVFDTM